MLDVTIVPWLGNSKFITETILNKLHDTSVEYLRGLISETIVLDGNKIFVEVRGADEIRVVGLFSGKEISFSKVPSSIHLFVADVGEVNRLNNNTVDLNVRYKENDQCGSHDEIYVF